MRLLRWVHFLCADVAVSVLAGIFFFSRLIGGKVQWEVYVLAGAATLALYNLDHLWDLRLISDASERRRFHQDHRKILMILSVFSFSTAIIVLPFIGQPYRLPGALLFVCVAICVLAGRRLRRLREPAVAAIYTMAVASPGLVNAGAVPVGMIWLLGLYIIVVYANTMASSCMDIHEDQVLTPGSALEMMSLRRHGWTQGISLALAFLTGLGALAAGIKVQVVLVVWMIGLVPPVVYHRRAVSQEWKLRLWLELSLSLGFLAAWLT
ncbi:MAG: hypothetical protein U0V64_11795 [Cyclobacteriaceae bacterium]